MDAAVDGPVKSNVGTCVVARVMYSVVEHVSGLGIDHVIKSQREAKCAVPPKSMSLLGWPLLPGHWRKIRRMCCVRKHQSVAIGWALGTSTLGPQLQMEL